MPEILKKRESETQLRKRSNNKKLPVHFKKWDLIYNLEILINSFEARKRTRLPCAE